jgi:zinc D-Ala-D-Ala carboxypeptidase
MNLSRNFTLQELIKSDTAVRLGVDNNPNANQIEKLKLLCENILQPVRDHFGPVTITSGFRSPTLCVKIGSSVNSQHTQGCAADFECPGKDNAEVADWIYKNLDFDQMILEFYVPGEPNSGWVHCSYITDQPRRKGNRFSMSKLIKVFSKIDTVHGLCEECQEEAILVAIVSEFYRCTNCGHDTKQHINGKIRYLQLDESDKKWIKDNINKNG